MMTSKLTEIENKKINIMILNTSSWYRKSQEDIGVNVNNGK